MAIVQIGQLIIKPIDDTLAWGEGAIVPQAQDDLQPLLNVVKDSLEPVTDQQEAFSACTDGRIPVKLLDGGIVPVREQMVGADTVSAFYVAETLGARFYKDPTAPVADRIKEVAEFLKDNDIIPSSHVGCGAAAGFVTITENAIRFAKLPAFMARQKALLPEGIYDPELHAQMMQGNQERLDKNLYQGLDAQMFLDTVEGLSGKQAIAELNEDGRGVHGHVEEAIMRIKAPGLAINEAKVAEKTGGREVFGVNDLRMERIARLFGRGNDQDYRMAYMALEDFADTGHGTLAKNLPTYIVTSI